jgi:hypothetical protein
VPLFSVEIEEGDKTKEEKKEERRFVKGIQHEVTTVTVITQK